MNIGRLMAGVYGQPKSKEAKRPLARSQSAVIDIAALLGEFLKHTYSSPTLYHGQWLTAMDWNRMCPYHKRSQGHFHPSSGLLEGIGCARSAVLDLLCATKSEPKVQASLAAILDNGTCRHVGMHTAFLGMARLGYGGVGEYLFETRLQHQSLPLEGSRDGKVVMQNGSSFIIDYKTVNANGFSKIAKDGPKESHVVQLNTYMGMGGDSVGIILYENKDNQRCQQCIIDFDPMLYRMVESRCKELLRFAVDCRLPEYDSATCRNSCTLCDYSWACSAERSGEDVQLLDNRTEELREGHRRALYGEGPEIL